MVIVKRPDSVIPTKLLVKSVQKPFPLRSKNPLNALMKNVSQSTIRPLHFR